MNVAFVITKKFWKVEKPCLFNKVIYNEKKKLIERDKVIKDDNEQLKYLMTFSKHN